MDWTQQYVGLHNKRFTIFGKLFSKRSRRILDIPPCSDPGERMVFDRIIGAIYDKTREWIRMRGNLSEDQSVDAGYAVAIAKG